MKKTDAKILKQMYLKLFNEITDTINELEVLKERLKNIQCETEELFINNNTNCQ